MDLRYRTLVEAQHVPCESFANVMRVSCTYGNESDDLPEMCRPPDLAGWVLAHERRFQPDDLLSAWHIVAPPVDIFGLLRWLRVETLQERAPGWAGAACAEGGRAFVWLDADRHAPTRRYVAAHELGHLLLHPLDETYRCRMFFTRDKVCAEADRFALDLLMPAWMLGPVSLRRESPALAAMFDVPESVMNRRLLELAGVLNVL